MPPKGKASGGAGKESGKCTAVTGEGNRCSNAANGSDGLCGTHRNALRSSSATAPAGGESPAMLQLGIEDREGCLFGWRTNFGAISRRLRSTTNGKTARPAFDVCFASDISLDCLGRHHQVAQRGGGRAAVTARGSAGTSAGTAAVAPPGPTGLTGCAAPTGMHVRRKPVAVSDAVGCCCLDGWWRLMLQDSMTDSELLCLSAAAQGLRKRAMVRAGTSAGMAPPAASMPAVLTGCAGHTATPGRPPRQEEGVRGLSRRESRPAVVSC